MSLLIEGIVRYRNPLSETSTTDYDNVIFFSNGFVGESGLRRVKDSFLNITIGFTNFTGESQVLYSTKQIEHNFSFDHLKKKVVEDSRNSPTAAFWFDERAQKFFLFREAFGALPIFYIHIPGIIFAFSTNIINLLKRTEIQEQNAVNSNKIIAYCSYSHIDFNQDASSTFYKHIKSAVPGHLMTIGPTSVSSKSIVQFNPERWQHLTTIEDIGDAVRQLFFKCISGAVGSKSNIIGADLSGGLDSSSICSAFRHLYPDRPLHTFHISANNTESDESEYALLVSKNVNSFHHSMMRSEDDLKNLKLGTNLYGQPEAQLLSPATNWALFSLARESGCDILLNGLGGDSIIGFGNEILDESFQSKNWTFFKSLIARSTDNMRLGFQFPDWDSFSSSKRYHLLLQNYLYRRFSAFRHLPLPELFRMYKEVSRELGISYYYFFRRASKNFLLRSVNRSVKSAASIIRDELIDSAKFSERELNFPLSIRGDLPSDYQDLFDDVFHPHVIRSREQSFMLSNHFETSNRSPFMNVELFELCLSIPNTFKYGNGIGRAHLREAMKGILIEEVRMRNTKSSVSSLDGEKMTLRLFNQAQYYLNDVQEVWNYVDRRKFNDQVKVLLNTRIPYGQKSAAYIYTTRTISLSVWLEWLKSN
jgi:asparagine synthase (glutamine-hydrolysing)